MSTHTPAPWTVDNRAIYGTRGLIKPFIASVEDDHNDSETGANARLIAAAPDLLEALIALHACHRGFSGSENWTALDDEAREFAEAAIAKATGDAQ